MSLFHELDHLRITLDNIILATNNFNHNNFLAQGGFGRVYKGQLLLSTNSSKRCIDVAVKRLDKNLGQGQHEFVSEIVMLSSYKHENLVSLVGFCEEGDEKVLVYEREVNGSLDNHLTTLDLTWEQRLLICRGTARGLEYLHEGVGEGHRVIHCDIKSSNILLDAGWEPKISDFGLSKIGPTNQDFTFLVTNACGTYGYVDPQYVKTGVLTKESDVYSFGVVLFEVVCGRLAMVPEYEDGRTFLSHLVKHVYEDGKLDEIILPNLQTQMNPASLETFAKIAYQCLNEDRKKRPTIGLIAQQLEAAYELQIFSTVSIRRLGLYGSEVGGDPWSFMLNAHQKLRKIVIGHNGCIYSIAFTTVDSNGWLRSSGQYGGSNSGDRAIIKEIEFDTDEEIIGISGTASMKDRNLKVVSSLCILTNKIKYGSILEKDNKTKYGPFGWEMGDRFSISWDVNSFVGFYGRAGFYLDAIGCCVKNGVDDPTYVARGRIRKRERVRGRVLRNANVPKFKKRVRLED